ncbi:hypothetical protein FCM35_KLT05018 [Carex littledalei]|uniref:Uncharacterized protein n=1 Tax=Carex littledalei TaxID=544730 RepID=A0A833QZG7_9POAL|nr:hypothetical protein FCM35_KLT05018 [Carex littledalei]
MDAEGHLGPRFGSWRDVYDGTLGQPASEHDMEAVPNQSGESNTDELLRRKKRSC